MAKVLKKTNGDELLQKGWVIKAQSVKGDANNHELFKVVKVGESSALCVPLRLLVKKVFDNREQEYEYYMRASGSINISTHSAVEVYGIHRNNLDKKENK